MVASAAIVAAAPLAGVARSQLQAALSARFGPALWVLIGAAVVTAAAVGLRRVRHRWWWRAGLVALSAAAAGAYVWTTGHADPSIRAVEAVHFVEYGLITFLFYRVWRGHGDVATFALPALAAFLAGVAEEAYQWFLPARVGELRDVWLNSVAIGCALLFSAGVAPPGRLAPLSARGARRIAWALVMAVLAVAAFVHAVHLGTRIALDHTSFDSRFAAAELDALARDRTERWRLTPPLVRPDRFSREDQYATEGLQHVQARNLAWTQGDAVTAWHENLILERHFAPVLDTPSYVAKAEHRWPPGQRADVWAQAEPGLGAPFESDAFPYPLDRWAPAAVWAVAAALASLAVAAGEIYGRGAAVRA